MMGSSLCEGVEGEVSGWSNGPVAFEAILGLLWLAADRMCLSRKSSASKHYCFTKTPLRLHWVCALLY